MSLSPDQRALRRTCVTASSVAAIVGLHPWLRAIDVWAEMTGHARPRPDTPWMAWGRALEPVVRNEYERRHGLRVEQPGTLVAEDNSRHAATPDGISYTWAGAAVEGLEIKVHNAWLRREYGTPGTDDVPAHELLQCAWGLRVLRSVDRWRLVVCLGGPPVEYVVERDDELERDLVEAVDEWLALYVDTRTPPPPDGSEAYSRHMSRSIGERAEVAAEDVAAELAAVKQAYAALSVAETTYRRAAQELQAAMGTATDIRTDAGRLTWRPRKDGVRVFRAPPGWRTEIE